MTIDLNIIREYFSSQPIDKAWLFGSFARGDAREDSDVDILINFTEKTKIGMKFISIINDLEARLQRNVDLVEEKSLVPWIKPYIEKDKILIYEREA
ncbi:MAG: nucleotidyltransferase domain-containing protein [Muribaculaceae bacterium]|nr:nucleotidyltransferase domain-containing protein [Muribaculaceae bacterium]